MLHIAVLGSGCGSNFLALRSAIEAGRIPGVRVGLVLSNSSTAGILSLAGEHRIPAVHLSRAQFADEQSFAGAMLGALRSHQTDMVVLAGYMKKVPPQVVAAYRNRILNIHPALLPRFGGPGMYGMRVHEAVLASGDAESGATVHLVDEEYDRGTIVLQRRVPVLPGDTPEVLAARVLEAEHALYPDALRLVVEQVQAAHHS